MADIVSVGRMCWQDVRCLGQGQITCPDLARRCAWLSRTAGALPAPGTRSGHIAHKKRRLITVFLTLLVRRRNSWQEMPFYFTKVKTKKCRKNEEAEQGGDLSMSEKLKNED